MATYNQNDKKSRTAKRVGKQETGRVPRLNKLFDEVSKALRPTSPAQTDAFKLEQLEPRLLLSADPLAALAANAEVTLKVVSQNSEQFIQLIDSSAGGNGTVLGERKNRGYCREQHHYGDRFQR